MTDDIKKGVPITITLYTIKPLLSLNNFLKTNNPYANYWSLAKAAEPWTGEYVKATSLDTLYSVDPMDNHGLASMPWISLNNCTVMDTTGRCVVCQRGFGIQDGVCKRCKGENYSTDGRECIPVKNCFKANHTHGGCRNCLEGFKKDTTFECQKILVGWSEISRVTCIIAPIILLLGIFISRTLFLSVAIYLAKSGIPDDHDMGIQMLEYLSDAPLFNREAMLALGDARQATKRRRQRVRMPKFLQKAVLICIICKSRMFS